MSQHPPRLHNCSMRRPQDVSLGRPHEVPSLTSGTASRTKREPPVFARSQTAKFLSHYHVTAIRGRAGKSGPGKSLDPPTPRSREILFRWVAAQKTEHGKRSNHQVHTENQHNQRGSIEKASCASTGVSTICSSLLVHKTATRYSKAARELCRAAFTTNCRSGPVPFIT